jgi:Protein of unknown function (DUF4065)
MELKSLVLYFVNKSHKSLGRTELMKYVYLFEYHYYQMFGKRFSKLEFERYKFGPNQSAVVQATFDLQLEGLIAIETYKNYYEGTSYDHHPVENDGDHYPLGPDSELVAGFVVDLLWNKNYRGVLDIAYATPPMREILEEEKQLGTHLYGRVIDMSKSGQIFKSTRQKRIDARKRLKAQQERRGSDSEYYSHLAEQYERFEDTRRRANIAES